MHPEPLENRWGIDAPLFALTFDDGPSEWTDAIREELQARGGTATFFVIGCVLRDEEPKAILRRLIGDGNEIGNHTFTHLPLTSMQLAGVRDEIVRTSAAIEDAGVETPRLWRAPYLKSTVELTSVVSALGLREVRASIVAADYAWTAAETAAYVLERLRAGDIVDLHDGRPPLEPSDGSRPNRLETVSAVSTILAAAEARGLRSVTVSELVASALV